MFFMNFLDFFVIKCYNHYNKGDTMAKKNFIFERRKGSPDFVIAGNHYHKHFEIYYLKSGRCRYFIDNKICEVSKGDIVIIPGGVIHNTTYYGNEPYERILMQITKEYINPVLNPKLQPIFKRRIYRPERPFEIEELLREIEEEYRENSDISEEMIKCRLTELFCYLIKNKPLKISDENSEVNAIISKITSYISKNFSQDIALSKTAEKAGFSDCYFSKFFKTQTGFGFKEFLLITRLREAKKLLSATELSVCEIAFACGFNDSNYFSSVFKKKEGVTPLEYRKKSNEKSRKK